MTVKETIHHLETLAITGCEIDLTAEEFQAIRVSIIVLKTLTPTMIQLIDAIMALETIKKGVNNGHS